MWKNLRILIAIPIVVCSASMLVWSYLPTRRVVEVMNLTPSEMIIHGEALEGGPTLLETRQVRLEWPESMRIGDNYQIVLDFEPAQDVSHTLKTAEGFYDVYDCCSVMAEARVEVAGQIVDPANPIRESMPFRRPARFSWVLNAGQAGTIPVTIWLSLRFLPLDGSTPIQGPIFVKDIQVDASSFFGLNAGMSRLTGWLGMVIGILLLSDVLFRLARNRRKMVINDQRDNTTVIHSQ